MNFITSLNKFIRLISCNLSKLWNGRALSSFPHLQKKSLPLHHRTIENRNYSITLLIFTVLFLITLFTFVPGKAFSKGGIVAVPIMDPQGKQVVLYKASYALVIGVSDYTGGWPKLPGVKTDVKAVKETLEKIGFKVILIEDPNRRELEDAFKDFVLEYGLDPENRLLFYYAGHGYTHKPNYANDDPEEWVGYIVSRNAPPANKNLAKFFKNSMTMRTIENIALSIESKHAIFIFDSCFSGSIFGISRGITQDIQERVSKPVRQFITSGTADQVVPDISIFRRQFISALEGEADRNQDNYVTGSELGQYLEETVTNLSRRSQTPRYGKILNRFLNKGDFVFKIKKKNSYQVASLNHEDLIESINRMADQVVANRGERSDHVQIHYSKLKELDKFDEGTISNKTKIKLWQNFITLFPQNNPNLAEAKGIVKRLSGKQSSSPVEEESIDQKIENRFAFLMDLEKKPISSEKKIEGWLGFVSDFPKNNPKLDLAFAKITELRKEQERLAEEKRLASKKMEEMEVASLEPDIPKVSPPKLTGYEGMVSIPAGRYVYGESGSQTTRILGAFYMDVQEVTQKDYEQVMGKNPSRFKGENLPVEKVTWQEAKEYCDRVGKRLPRETEWEMAWDAGYRWRSPWGHHRANSYRGGYGDPRGYPPAEYPGDDYGDNGTRGAWSYGSDDFSVYRDSHYSDDVYSKYGLRCAR
jgi:uncharacterized caspase-like protein